MRATRTRRDFPAPPGRAVHTATLSCHGRRQRRHCRCGCHHYSNFPLHWRQSPPRYSIPTIRYLAVILLLVLPLSHRNEASCRRRRRWSTPTSSSSSSSSSSFSLSLLSTFSSTSSSESWCYVDRKEPPLYAPAHMFYLACVLNAWFLPLSPSLDIIYDSISLAPRFSAYIRSFIFPVAFFARVRAVLRPKTIGMVWEKKSASR